MTQGEVLFHPPRALMSLCGALAVLGGAALLVGFWQAPERAWPNLLLISFYLLGLGLSGLVFVALMYVTGAGWSVALRRVPETMAAVIPLAALGLALVFVARPSLYPWASSTPQEAESYPPLRQIWFNQEFFLARAVLYFACWLLLGFALVRTSRLQDRDGDLALTRRNVRLSAAFLVVFGLTFWLASSDWLMSLEPDWSSTIFSVYHFAGLFLSGLAVIVLLAACLRWLGPFRHVLTVEHLHDLGKLLFGFSSFWMYIWFCQYMLIWYVNAHTETGYFARRLHGVWGTLLVLDIGLNWGIPFLVLLPRGAKQNVGVLATVSLIVLAGRWLDLYLGILPYFGEPTAVTVAWELSLLAGATALFALVFFAVLGRTSLIPIGDPYLLESLPVPAEGTDRAATLGH